MLARPTPRRRWAARFLLAALAGAAALAAAELALRRTAGMAHLYDVWWPHLRVVFHPDPEILPGVEGEAHFAVSSLGLRGAELPGEEGFRFVAIGGSTTECLYLDQGESWPELTASILREATGARGVWVGNGGKSGLCARDHVVQLEALSPRLAAIGTDAVVFLVGVNDLTQRLALGDEYEAHALEVPGVRERTLLRVFQRIPFDADPRVPWWKRSALYTLLGRAANRWAGTGASRPDRGEAVLRWRAHRAGARSLLDELPDVTAALAEYERNLHELVSLCEAIGARPILLTQPSLWRDDLTPRGESLLLFGGVGDFLNEPGCDYYTARALREAMDRYNSATASVARARGTGLVDLAARVEPDLRHFYDDVHFSELGSARVAELLAEHLLARPPFAPAPGSPPEEVEASQPASRE